MAWLTMYSEDDELWNTGGVVVITPVSGRVAVTFIADHRDVEAMFFHHDKPSLLRDPTPMLCALLGVQSLPRQKEWTRRSWISRFS